MAIGKDNCQLRNLAGFFFLFFLFFLNVRLCLILFSNDFTLFVEGDRSQPIQKVLNIWEFTTIGPLLLNTGSF